VRVTLGRSTRCRAGSARNGKIVARVQAELGAAPRPMVAAKEPLGRGASGNGDGEQLEERLEVEPGRIRVPEGFPHRPSSSTPAIGATSRSIRSGPAHQLGHGAVGQQPLTPPSAEQLGPSGAGCAPPGGGDLAREAERGRNRAGEGARH